MKHKLYWLHPSLEVRETENCGFGTHAINDIKKGDILLVLSGYVMNLSDEEKLPGSLSDNGIQITDNLSLCVSKKSELGGIGSSSFSVNSPSGFT